MRLLAPFQTSKLYLFRNLFPLSSEGVAGEEEAKAPEPK